MEPSFSSPTAVDVFEAFNAVFSGVMPFFAFAVGISLGLSILFNLKRLLGLGSSSSPSSLLPDEETWPAALPSRSQLRWCLNCSALTSPLEAQYCIVCGAPMHLRSLPGPPDDDGPFIGPTRKL